MKSETKKNPRGSKRSTVCSPRRADSARARITAVFNKDSGGLSSTAAASGSHMDAVSADTAATRAIARIISASVNARETPRIAEWQPAERMDYQLPMSSSVPFLPSGPIDHTS